jgi:putative ABC transport system permease protein
MRMSPILAALLRNKTGAILVAVQIAVSLAILSNALHIVQVRQAVAARPSGLIDEASTFNVSTRWLLKETPEYDLAVQKREVALMRAIPGVAGVATTNQMPLSRSGSTNSVSIDRKQVNETASASTYYTDGLLVGAWGLRLIQGRDFTAGDVLDLDVTKSNEFPKTVIITRALAEKIWPGEANVVGKTLLFGVGEDANPTQVIGVLDRLQSAHAQVNEDGEFSAILPQRSLGGTPGASYTVRTEPGQRDRVMKEVEEVLRKATATPVIVRMKSTSEDRTDRYRADVALSWMLITVSVLLLIITASGIVGMASLLVTQRRKQIGVRRALGARKVDILRYFITENLMITATGVVCGVLLAIGLNELLVSKLEMAKLPLHYLVYGTGVFFVLGVAAVYGPAWRGASISPAMATRSA